MVSVVDLFQAFLQDVRVNLSRADIRVPEKFLNRANIVATFE